MDKKESLLRQKAKAEKEAAQYENQVKILLNKQRDAERHARNHRLIVHGAIMEGVFPFTASMDGESLKAFLIALRLDVDRSDCLSVITSCKQPSWRRAFSASIRVMYLLCRIFSCQAAIRGKRTCPFNVYPSKQ